MEEKTKTREEEIIIIKKYQEMMMYVYNLLKKYPNAEKFALASETKIHKRKGCGESGWGFFYLLNYDISKYKRLIPKV